MRVDSLPHRKWKETKQHPSMLPGPAVPGSCLVSFHFLWGQTIYAHCILYSYFDWGKIYFQFNPKQNQILLVITCQRFYLPFAYVLNELLSIKASSICTRMDDFFPQLQAQFSRPTISHFRRLHFSFKAAQNGPQAHRGAKKWRQVAWMSFMY